MIHTSNAVVITMYAATQTISTKDGPSRSPVTTMDSRQVVTTGAWSVDIDDISNGKCEGHEVYVDRQLLLSRNCVQMAWK